MTQAAADRAAIAHRAIGDAVGDPCQHAAADIGHQPSAIAAWVTQAPIVTASASVGDAAQLRQCD